MEEIENSKFFLPDSFPKHFVERIFKKMEIGVFAGRISALFSIFQLLLLPSSSSFFFFFFLLLLSFLSFCLRRHLLFFFTRQRCNNKKRKRRRTSLATENSIFKSTNRHRWYQSSMSIWDSIRSDFITGVKLAYPSINSWLQRVNRLVAQRKVGNEDPPLYLSKATNTLPDDPYGQLKLSDISSDNQLRRHLQLMLLSALAYDDPKVVDYVLRKAAAPAWSFIHSAKGENDTQALLVKCNDDTLVLSFRGTEPENFVDWMTDANIRNVPSWKGHDGGLLHNGFYTSLEEFEKHLEKNLEFGKFFDVSNTTVKKNLLVTGHSLGAGLAVVAGAWISSKAAVTPTEPSNTTAKFLQKVTLQEVVGFGGPVVGDSVFTKNMEDQFASAGVKCFHYVLRNDIIPRLHNYKNNVLPFARVSYTDFKDCVYLDGTSANSRTAIPTLEWEQIRLEFINKAFHGLAVVIPGALTELLRGNIVDTSQEWNDLCSKLFPSYAYDHFPSEYLKALQNALQHGGQ